MHRDRVILRSGYFLVVVGALLAFINGIGAAAIWMGQADFNSSTRIVIYVGLALGFLLAIGGNLLVQMVRIKMWRATQEPE